MAIVISSRAGLLAIALASAAGPLASPLFAQEVVQALPPRESAQLSDAMRRLARAPTDLDALLTAGNASLVLNDAGAAAGFFARAATVAPNDPRVVLGQARVALEQRRPVEALTGFARAERAGVRPAEMAADRALAYDLVGDNAAAQALYRSIIGSGDDAEARRRLALSFAISGNKPEFERTLNPLLQKQDRSAYRTRAFGLAILGLTDAAVDIADAMMPTDLALRMAPYLRYMPRLTKAQQAAAANLGAFPAATEIGRDSPEIASYATAGARIAARGDASLTPSGAALGPRPSTRVEAPVDSVVRTARSQPERDVRVASSASSPPARRTPGVEVTQLTELPPVADTAQGTSSQRVPKPTPVPAQTAAPSPAPAQITTPRPALAETSPVVVASVPPAAVSLPEAERVSLSEAFADLGPAPVAATAPAPGAVDVARLSAQRQVEEAIAKKQAEARAKAKREADAKAAKAKAEEAAKKAEPARRWIQIGVGRNVSAFAFDWKKLAKQAGGALDGKGPWAADYGATNRMLAGPYPNESAVRTAMKQLKDKGIEALPFNSDEGEKVVKAN